MKRNPAILLGGLLLLLSACGSSDPPPVDPAVEATPEAAETAVERAIKLALAIQADPAHAEDVLAGAGLSIEDFENLLVAVASNPRDAAAYSAAVN